MPFEKRAQESSGKCRSIHPCYHRVFIFDFSITSHTIVTTSQRPPQRAKSESPTFRLFRAPKVFETSSQRSRKLIFEAKPQRPQRRRHTTPCRFPDKASPSPQNRSAVNSFLDPSFHYLLQLFVCDSLMISGTKVYNSPESSKFFVQI